MFGLQADIIYKFPPEFRGSNAELLLRVAGEAQMLVNEQDTDLIPRFTAEDCNALARAYVMFTLMRPEQSYTQQIYDELDSMRTALQRIADYHSGCLEIMVQVTTAAREQIHDTFEQLQDGIDHQNPLPIIRLYQDQIAQDSTPEGAISLNDQRAYNSLIASFTAALNLRQPNDIEELFDMVGRPTDLVQAEAALAHPQAARHHLTMVKAIDTMLSRLDEAMIFGAAPVVALRGPAAQELSVR